MAADHAYWLSKHDGPRGRSGGHGVRLAEQRRRRRRLPRLRARRRHAVRSAGRRRRPHRWPRPARLHPPVPDVGPRARCSRGEPHRPEAHERLDGHDRRRARPRRVRRRPPGDHRRTGLDRARRMCRVGDRRGLARHAVHAGVTGQPRTTGTPASPAARPASPPFDPERLFDTRGESPNALRQVEVRQVGGGYELEVKATDLPGLVPASGVGAVTLNVAVDRSRGPGFVTVYPCGQRKLTASVNYAARGDRVELPSSCRCRPRARSASTRTSRRTSSSTSTAGSPPGARCTRSARSACSTPVASRRTHSGRSPVAQVGGGPDARGEGDGSPRARAGLRRQRRVAERRRRQPDEVPGS